MVELLISELKDVYKIAVLSRGYKRRSSGFLLANDESTVAELGDEPYQIHKKFEDIAVAVDADRANGVSILEKETKPDMIILDDAFQHRRITPTFSILLTAHDKLFCNDYFLPTGSLRDGRNQAKRANTIVVTKCPSKLPKKEQNQIIKMLRPEPHQKVLFSFLEYSNCLKGSSGERTLEKLDKGKITLVTGIADPKPLLTYLKLRGLNFEHLRFNDHHEFTGGEIDHLNTKKLILTTEKDYVRLKGKVKNLLYIEIGHKFFGDGKKELIGTIQSAMKRDS